MGWRHRVNNWDFTATPACNIFIYDILWNSHYMGFPWTRRADTRLYVRSNTCSKLQSWEKIVKQAARQSEKQRGKEKQILQSLCLLLAPGFYGKRKVENLREIDEYPWHALTQTAHTFLLFFVGVFLSSPLLCLFHVFPFSTVTNSVQQGKDIPYSKGKKAP